MNANWQQQINTVTAAAVSQRRRRYVGGLGIMDEAVHERRCVYTVVCEVNMHECIGKEPAVLEAVVVF